ncbi:hypothetical protein A6R68_07250 [Neotoma lepida]|uniref:Putative treble-clef zinc-finger domain-containing protein n=1 Tax=Neotoma lepida TaxID=56216 RepID=A0A1A6GEM3_NEOLE|nr:hypothetical protein A6R68_07250 [Neotoma lepida]
MEPNSQRTKVPASLSDLGKATLRGITKCPRCGTYNGTRGLNCKNKTCGTIFCYGARKQPSIEAVKIITGSDLQVYSVWQRDQGPDYRCLVELGVSATTIQTVDGTIITQLSSGRCYVPSCLKAATQGMVENQCQHIKLAVNCQAEATPLTLKSSVLNAMQASPETKQTIWQLATEPTGPRTLKSHKSSIPKAEAAPRCIHFFVRLCAFASDETLAQEFSDFLNFDASGLKELIVPQLGCHSESSVSACESAASKPWKRKKEEVSDTPEMPLEITRSFIQNQDGTYELFKCPKVEVERIAETYSQILKQPVLRSLELKTFLKVDNTSPDQKEPTPFIIEWILDILPQSKISELQIKFEYGHHRNGHVADYQDPRPPLDQPLELVPLTTITFP